MTNLKERARALKRTIPALFIAMRQPGNPLAAKFLAGIAVGYALSPIDLVPDFIPVLGYLGDLLILPLLVALAIRLIPPQVMQESLAKSDRLWGNDKPKKCYYGIPILLLWAAVVAIIGKGLLL